MGQKVHPYGFRLGYTKPWRSRWFAKQGYAALLHEDLKLKASLRKRLKAAGISSIEVDRPGNRLRITIRTALQGNVLFLTVACALVPANAVTPDIMRKMLDADNGISTSGFQLYDHGDGRVAVTLNNFCKLQAMGSDDEDDILSCLEFLMADAVDARDLLGDLE